MAASVVAEPDTYLGGPLFAGNRDWHDLERWSAGAPGPILIGLHPHVVQYWASLRLRSSGYALLVPQDTVGGTSAAEQAHHETLAEVPDGFGPLRLDPAAVTRSRMFLDWAFPTDVTRNVLSSAPVARNTTFALYRMEDVADFLTLREGWHGLAPADAAGQGSSTLRWMGARATLLLFRFSSRPIRLVLGVQSGVGLPTLDRQVTVSHRGRLLSTFDVEGGGRVVTPPFVPEGPIDEVVLEVAGEARPMPRAFTAWNSWVQHDPRSLALGVSDVRARPAGEPAGLEGDLGRRWRPREIRARFLYGGLQADDCIGRRFAVTVPARARRARIAVAGLTWPQPVSVTVDHGAARVVDLEGGVTQIVEVELTGPAGPDGHTVTLEFTRWREEPTTSQVDLDRRRTTGRLLWVDLR